ncbi:MAG: PAS domain S-box protein [Elusimicrobia bacterium]|nr:PAS domain S-box protein [Elusimicrobiota bacterium]
MRRTAGVLVANKPIDANLSVVLDGLPAALVMVARDGEIVLVNRRAEALFGYTRDELLGGPVHRLVPERFRGGHAERIEAFFRSPKHRALGTGRDLVGARRDGTEVPVDIGLEPIETADGTFVLATILDVSERRRAQAKLLQMEAIIESSEDAIVSKALDGTIRTWNKGAERIFGYTAEEAVGRTMSLIIPPDRVDEEPQILAQIQAGERVEHYETVRKRKDGTLVEVSVTISPVKDASGEVIGASKIAHDITDVRSTRVFLDSIIENIPVMLFMKEAKDLRFVRFNKAGEELLGVTRDKLIGKNDYDFFPKDQADHFTKKDREVLASGRMMDILEEPIETRLHGRRILHTMKLPLAGPDGNPAYLLGISEDITEKRLAAERLLDVARRKEEFAAMVSHDLRSPLTAIKMAIETAAEECGGSVGSAAVHALSSARRNIDRLARLVNDVLDFEKLESGKMQFELEPCDVSALASETLAGFEPIARERGLSLVKRLGADLPAVSCDKDKITQVLVNLVDNAIKYSRQGSVIVATEAADGGVKVSVVDQGPGIRREDQGKIFEAFVRLSEGTRRREGTGLGLAICRRIVESHGGRIWIESEEGSGAAFNFTLPAKPA